MHGPLLLAASALATTNAIAVLPQPVVEQSEAPIFVTLDPITTPIFGPSRIEGTFHVSIVLQARDGNGSTAIKDNLHELRASSLATVIEFSRIHATGFTPVNAEKLRTELSTTLTKTHPEISNVLIVKLSAMPA